MKFLFATMAVASAANVYPDPALYSAPTGHIKGIKSPATTGTIGVTACPVKCMSTQTEGSVGHASSKDKGWIVQVYHATSDGADAHSPTNVIAHTCKHDADTGACVCTCTGPTAAVSGDGKIVK